MERVLKENDIITIEENQKFFVFKCFEYNNENYAYVIKVKELENEEDLSCIIKEFIFEDKLLIDVVREPKEVEPLIHAFIHSIKKDKNKNQT